MANQHPSWSAAELQKLHDSPHLSHAELGALLGRSAASVQTRRSRLRTQGADIPPMRNSPAATLSRRALLAKTCTSCGLLLDADWYSKRADGRRMSKCRSCRAVHNGSSQADKPARRLAQEYTAAHAERNGAEWTDAELAIIGGSDLTLAEMALHLGRSLSAVINARHRSGIADRRVALAEPVETWRIHLPACVNH